MSQSDILAVNSSMSRSGKTHQKGQQYLCKYCGKEFIPYSLDGKLHTEHCHSIKCMKEHSKKPTKLIKVKRAFSPTIVTSSETAQYTHPLSSICRICKNPFIPVNQGERVCGSSACKRKEKQKNTDRIYNLLYPKLLEDYFEEPREPIIRECLKCEKPFESSGDRLCPKCVDSNKQIMEW